MKARTDLKPFLIGASALLIVVMNSVLGGSALSDLTTDQQDRGQDERQTLTPQLQSPADIEQYVNEHSDDADLGEIWTMFGLASKEGGPGKCGAGNGRCSAQTIGVESSEGHREYEILRICYAGEHLCWFLLFKKQAVWKAMSDVANEYSHYQEVKHRLVSCAGKHWLLVTVDTGGTGALTRSERWLEIGNDGLSEVLTYPVAGHSVQGDPGDNEYVAKVSSETSSAGCEVVVRYQIRSDSFGTQTGWATSDKRQVGFMWSSGAKRFELDKLRSELDDSGKPSIRAVFGKIFRLLK